MVSRLADDDDAARDRGERATDVDPRLVWRTGRDALDHGLDLARIQVWRAGERARSVLLRLGAAVVAAVVLLAVTVTAAVWATVALLEGLSAAAGGGLPGFAVATAAFLAAALAFGVTVKAGAARARVARWRARAARGEARDGDRQPVQGREQAALAELEAETLDALRRDGEVLAEQGARLWRAHPIASLGVGAATGFAATRLVLAAPRPWRRSVVSLIRSGRAAGLALGAGALREVMRSDSRDARRAGSNGKPER